MSLPAFPPPLVPSATSRRAYKREESPAGSPACRRYSHSRGRPRTSPLERDNSVSRDRSERADSRAPLVRKMVSRTPLSAFPSVATSPPLLARFPRFLSHFLGHRPEPPRVHSPALTFLGRLSPTTEALLLNWAGSFVSILLAASINYALSLTTFTAEDTIPLAMGSLGATAVLIYGLPESPLSTPRNVLGGHLLSALTGIIISRLLSLAPNYSAEAEGATPRSFADLTPVAGALSVATALTIMQLTRTVHPPGGATALIACVRPNAAYLQFSFLLIVLLNVTAMVLWALVVGNLGRRKYPAFWWKPVIEPSNVPLAYAGFIPPTLEGSHPHHHHEAEREDSNSPDRGEKEGSRRLSLGMVGEEQEDEERGRPSLVTTRR